MTNISDEMAARIAKDEIGPGYAPDCYASAPVSEERLNDLAHHMDGHNADAASALRELATARTTIAELRKELNELRGNNSTKE